MGTYKGIQGYSIQSLSSDPPGAQSVGQLWYNSSSNVWKLGSESSGAFSAAPSLSTARSNPVGYGTITAALVISGDTTPGTYTPASEEYNGTAWGSGGAVTTYGAQEAFGTGTQTAGLWMGGYESDTSGGGIKQTCEEYDGTSWTAGGGLTQKRRGGASAGTQTAAILFAGMDGFVPGGPGSVKVDNCQEYDGSTWTNSPNINAQVASCAASSMGTQTAAVRAIGSLAGHGAPGASVLTVANYDGSSWSEGTSANTGRPTAAGWGISTSAMISGGEPVQATTEQWNGTAWTTVSSLATARSYPRGAGVANSAGLVMTGRTPTYSGATEEWASPAYVTETVTTS
tara:strand:- start:1509 stop:2537 length:1029 start_codon:yes stop_codon:yes gene_type:complete